MSIPVKHLRTRPPLTFEEMAGGQRYYSEANIKRILQSFVHRSDLDKAQFARELEIAALWFVNLVAAGRGKPPSILQREWEQEAEKIEGVIAEFDQRDGREQAALEYAAEQLVQRMGGLPDLAPKTIELPPVPGADPSPSDNLMVWPIEEQLQKVQATIRWYYECVKETAARGRR